MDAISSMLNINASNALDEYNTSKIQGSLNSVSSDSTEEELLETCKDFTSYFVEEVLKEVKENMIPEDEDEDSTTSMLTDYHMDSVIELMADKVTDEVGDSFVQQLYEQMKRNYNID